MTFHYPESNSGTSPLSEIYSGLRQIEETIVASHEHHEADPDGVHVMEMYRLPKEWKLFIEEGAETLNLSSDEETKMFELIDALLKGTLLSKEHEDELMELAALKLRYDTLRSH